MSSSTPKPEVTSEKELWRSKLDDAPIESCGRLDMSTSLPDETTLGRVTSDRVRYVYFKDGSECIVLGKFADFVAFKAADYAQALAERDAKHREEVERLKALVAEGQKCAGAFIYLDPNFDTDYNRNSELFRDIFKAAVKESERVYALCAEALA